MRFPKWIRISGYLIKNKYYKSADATSYVVIYVDRIHPFDSLHVATDPSPAVILSVLCVTNCRM